jgi:pyruvate/2-oxoacid:ferredoxin oxidoreductase beta subunit
MARLAVESRMFPLWSCDHGVWQITYAPRHPVPVRDVVEAQGRYAHLDEAGIEEIQAHVDERWERFVARAGT